MSTKRKPSRRRAASKLPGVSLTPLDATGWAWRLRWTENGRDCERKVRHVSRADAQRLQQHLQAELLLRLRDAARDQVDTALSGAPKPERQAKLAARITIADAIARDYYQKLAREPHPSQSTLRNTERALVRYVEWCKLHGLTLLEQVTRVNLAEYAKHVRTARRLDGKLYKVSSANLDLKILRSAFYSHMSDVTLYTGALHLDDVKLGLRHQPIKNKNRAGVKEAVALTQDQIRAALKAAIAYDRRVRAPEVDTRWPRKLLSVDIALLLLHGLRRLEYVTTTCGAVTADRQELASIQVLGKGQRPRIVRSRGYTVVGADILLAQVEGHAADEWLSEHTYQTLEDALNTAVRDFGMPKFSPHVLRATCATYQASLSHNDSHRRGRRLGHSIEIADQDYFDNIPGLPYDAPSLEAAMGAEAEFKAVLALLRGRKPTPRIERRNGKLYGLTEALLNSSDTVLANAVTPALRVGPPEAP